MEKTLSVLHRNNEENRTATQEEQSKFFEEIIKSVAKNSDSKEPKYQLKENTTIIISNYPDMTNGDYLKFTEILEKFHKPEKMGNLNELVGKKLDLDKSQELHCCFAYKGKFGKFLKGFSEKDNKFQELMNDKNFAQNILREIESIIFLMSEEDIPLLFNIEDLMFNQDTNKITLLPTEHFLNTNLKLLLIKNENSKSNEAYINIWILAFKLILGGFENFYELKDKLNQHIDLNHEIIKILEKDFHSNSNECFQYQFLFAKYLLKNRRNGHININELFEFIIKEKIYFPPFKILFNIENKHIIKKVGLIKESLIKIFTEMNEKFKISSETDSNNEVKMAFLRDINKISEIFFKNPKDNRDQYYSASFLISCEKNLGIWNEFNKSGVELIRDLESSLDEKNDILMNLKSDQVKFQKDILCGASEIIKIIIDLKQLMKNSLRKDDSNFFLPILNSKLLEIVNQPIFKMRLDKDQLIEEMKKFEVRPINEMPEEDKAFNRDQNDEMLPNNNSNKLKAKSYSSGNQLNIKNTNYYSQELENSLSINKEIQNLSNFNERKSPIIQELEEQISHYKQQIKEMEAKYTENKEQLIQDFKKELEEKNYELKKLDKKIDSISFRIEADQKAFKDLRAIIENQKIEIEILNKKIEYQQIEFEERISTNYQQKIEEIEAKSNKKIEQKRQSLENKLEKKNIELNQYKDDIVDLQRKNAIYESRLIELKTKNTEQERRIQMLTEKNEEEKVISSGMAKNSIEKINELKNELSKYQESEEFSRTNSDNSASNDKPYEKKDDSLECEIPNSENGSYQTVRRSVEQKTQTISKNNKQNPISSNNQVNEDSKEKKELKYVNKILSNSNPNVNPNPHIELNVSSSKKGKQSGKNIILPPSFSVQNSIPPRYDNFGMNIDPEGQSAQKQLSLNMNYTNNKNFENQSENENSESIRSSEEKKYENL